MRSGPSLTPRLARMAFLVGVGVALSLAVAALLVVSAYAYLLPDYAWRVLVAVAPFVPIAAVTVVLHRRPSTVTDTTFVRSWILAPRVRAPRAIACVTEAGSM